MGRVGDVLVGRERERRLLSERLAEAAVRSSVLLVVGEAGIGKTRLVEAAVAEAVPHGRVLRGACSPLSGAVAYAPLQVVVAAGTRSAAGIPPATPTSRPELYAQLDGVVIGEEGGPATVLLVEDLHWADASTLGYLAHLSRNVPPSGLALVMTFREDGGDDLHETWLAEQRRHGGVATVDLDPLGPVDTRDLLRSLRPDVTDADARRVHQRSGGNPYLATELAFSVDAEDGVPRSLRQVLGAVLRQVDPTVRDVAAAAHAVGRYATQDELGAAVPDPRDFVAARGARLVEPVPGDPDRWRARHPVLAELAYDWLSAPQRRTLHARLAVVAEATLPAQPKASHLADVARHHLAAGHHDDILLWSVRAGHAAEAECAFAEAGRWFAVALDAWPLAPTTTALVPDRSELVEAAGRNLSVAGRHREVITLVDPYVDAGLEAPAGALSGGGAALAALLVHRSWSRFVEGDTEGARADIDRAVAALDPASDPAVAADVFAQRGMIEITCSDVAAAEQAADEAVRLARASGNRAAWGRATAILGATDMLAGRTGRGLTRLDDGLRATGEVGDADGFALIAVVVAAHHAESSSPGVAARAIDDLRARLRLLAPDGHWLDEMITAHLVVALADAGMWDRARAALAGTSPALGFANVAVALVDARAGRGDEALDALHRWAGLDRRDQPQFHLMFAVVRGELGLLGGRLREVVAEATDALTYIEDKPDLLLDGVPLLLVGMRAAAGLGDRAAVERFAAALAGRLGPVEVAARAQASAERAEPPAAADLWEATARAWSSLGRPYEESVAWLRAAQAHLSVRGRRSRATTALAAAHDLAELVGCPPVMAEVDQLARAARLPVPGQSGPGSSVQVSTAAGRAPGPDLTDREAQVLALVAAGRTNRQIGERLYMSPKTASVHVTRILQKLGVSTRVQAATVAVQRGLVPVAEASETAGTPRP